MEALWNGIRGILLPLLVVLLLQNTLNLDQSTKNRLLTATLISPWAVQSIRTIVPQIHHVSTTCSLWNAMRKPILDETRDTLQQRISNGRAIRSKRFDLYLPPTYTGRALLFVPGACVPHVAYAQVASQLSEQGVAVVVISAEPVCMPSVHLGCCKKSMQRVMKNVDRKYLPYPARWSLGGHSMGAFCAMRLSSELMNPSHLVFWGMGPYKEARSNISSTTIPVLVVHGSNDKLCEYTPEAWNDFEKDLPPHCVYVVIPGATHNQFATYSNDPAVDGIPGISSEEQHQLVVEATAEFLFKDTY